jgi:anti-sigma factor RsiW
MKMARANNECRRIRTLLYSATSRRFGPDARWFQKHVAACPRCRRRLAASRKVDLAFSLVKTQPHKLDLMARANARAIAVLKHSLRVEPEVPNLKTKMPEPKLPEMFRGCGRSIANAAACVAILLLMKTGVLSSMGQLCSTGQKGMERYYAKRIGEDLAGEVFGQDANQPSPPDSDRVFGA